MFVCECDGVFLKYVTFLNVGFKENNLHDVWMIWLHHQEYSFVLLENRNTLTQTVFQTSIVRDHF